MPHIYTQSKNKRVRANMLSTNSQVVKISSNGWYVETRTGYDGPFDSEKEASDFHLLIQSSEAARMEFAGLQYTPLDSI